MKRFNLPLAIVITFLFTLASVPVITGCQARIAPPGPEVAPEPPHIQLEIPPPPMLIYPGAGDLEVSIIPTFEWHESSGASTYSLQVSNDGTFGAGGLVANKAGIHDSYYALPVTESLSPDTFYWWRASASNPAGTSDWSFAWKFKTEEQPSGPQEEEQPSEQPSASPVTVPTFISGAVVIAISTDDEGEELGIVETPNTGLPIKGAVVVFIATDDEGEELRTDADNIIKFIIANGKAIAKGTSYSIELSSQYVSNDISILGIIVAPAENAKIENLSYEIEVSKDLKFAIENVKATTSEQIYRWSPPLEYGTNYYCRVRTVSTTGQASGWSETLVFTTPVAPAEPRP